MSLVFSIGTDTDLPSIWVGLSHKSLDRIISDEPFKHDLAPYGQDAMLFITHNSLHVPAKAYQAVLARFVEARAPGRNALVIDLNHGNLKRLRRGNIIVREYLREKFPVHCRVNLAARETEQDFYAELREQGFVNLPEITFDANGHPARVQ